jgi:hypothetical protein
MPHDHGDHHGHHGDHHGDHGGHHGHHGHHGDLEAHSVSNHDNKTNSVPKQEGAPAHHGGAHPGHPGHDASCPCVTKEHTPLHALPSLHAKIPAPRPENSRHDCVRPRGGVPGIY